MKNSALNPPRPGLIPSTGSRGGGVLPLCPTQLRGWNTILKLIPTQTPL